MYPTHSLDSPFQSVQISKASNPDSITSYLLERIKQRRGEMQDEDDSDDDGEFD